MPRQDYGGAHPRISWGKGKRSGPPKPIPWSDATIQIYTEDPERANSVANVVQNPQLRIENAKRSWLVDFGVQIDDFAVKISAREERILQGDIQALNAGE